MMVMGRSATLLLTFVILRSGAAHAIEPFGFQFGMSRAEVEHAAAHLGTVFGRAQGWGLVIVDASDNKNHSYLFNFCKGQLNQATEIHPLDMQGFLNLIDESIRLYGQPKSVSSERLAPPSGKLYAITWTWKIDDATALVVEELEVVYRVNYNRTSSECQPAQSNEHTPTDGHK